MTYNEAEQKIFDAYFKDEIKPLDNTFCFCGNLCDKDYRWNYAEVTSYKGYSFSEYKSMELALLSGMYEYCYNWNKFRNPLGYEEALFYGICKALDVLKKIHISRGEIIDAPIRFKKRELNTNTSQVS